MGSWVRGFTGISGQGESGGRLTRRTAARRPRRRLRQVLAAGLAPVMAAGTSLVPVAVTVSAAAAVSAMSATLASAPARASSGSVLVLLQSGTTAPETADAQAAGYTVTQVSPATWRGMTAAQFGAYSALVIGDPSTGTTCSKSVLTTATSGTTGLGTTWQSAVNGKVSVLGTGPALAGSSGAASLVTDAISYAATQPASGSVTGLYVSLNCAYSTSTAGTAVPLLNGVEGAGAAGGLEVTGQGATCAAANNTGTVNKLEADQAPPFGGLGNSALASGQWPSPACAVQETFSSWPANYTPVAYDSSATGTANFTASDGVTGQPYVLLGGPAASAATQALAPTVGGEVPEVSTTGGQNAAAPGVQQATAGDPVNTENGDFTQSSTDVNSLPGFGPSLDFTRTYDADTAAEQTEAGTPGPMGYGWTDSLASSLTVDQPTPDDIYTLDGLATDTGNGGPATSGVMNQPSDAYESAGNLYIADFAANRIEEVAGSTGTQWGLSMTAGDMYTIAGDDGGLGGDSQSGTPMASSRLAQPIGVTLDSAGNLYIADTNNNRILEVPVTTGTQRGIAMTADDIYTIAGSATNVEGDSGDGGAATSALLSAPTAITVDKPGANPALEIADNGNNRIQYLFESGGTDWEGHSYTANDIYTIAGSSTDVPGNSGDGGTATAAALNGPEGICLSATGDLYIADEFNDQIRVVPGASTSEWGPSMSAGHIYTVVGDTSGDGGTAPNGTAATSALLNGPTSVTCAGSTDLYITDQGNNEVQEVPTTATTAWGVSMAADKIYTIAGSSTDAFGFSGNGGAATSALFNEPSSVTLDSSGNLDIADTQNNEIRQVSATTFNVSDFAGSGGTFQQDGDGGPSTTAGLRQPDAVAFDSAGDLFIADLDGNRVQEIAARSHTQFGIVMTAGDVYTVAGSAAGLQGDSGDGGLATAATLDGPDAVTVDSAGNLYLADSANGMIKKVSASTGIITAVAGEVGQFGDAGNKGPATSATLGVTTGLAVDAAGDVYISDGVSNQVREVAAVAGTQWGQTMTAGDIYLIAGNSDSASGNPTEGGKASAAALNEPSGLAVDPAGDLYVSDGESVQEIAVSNSTQWGQKMTAADIYDVAGSPSGGGSTVYAGDGGPARSAVLNQPDGVTLDPAGDLLIADSVNDVIREVAASNGTQWGQNMTAGDIYTIAGNVNADPGENGDDGPATDAGLAEPEGIAVDQYGDLYIPDFGGQELREVTATTVSPFPLAPSANAIDITQPDGSKVSFYPKAAGTGQCVAPYVVGGQYCTLPENINATLTFNSANGGSYTYSPSPGTTYVYGSSGSLESETDPAGNTLSVSYGALAPGSGSCPTGANSCDVVTAASGRTLTVGHNAAGMVTSVTDRMGRKSTYAYSGGDLTSATDPMGNVTSYTYGAGSTGIAVLANDLLTITSPNAQPGGPDAGDATTNVYNVFGEVTSQTDPMGFKTTFNYCVNAIAADCLNLETGTGPVTVTDPDGNHTVYDYQQGAIAAKSVFTGSTLTSETDTIPDTTASGASGGTLLDTTTADADGNVTTSTYDAAGNPTSTTAPDGVGSQTATTTQASTALGNASCASTSEASSTCAASPGPSSVLAGGPITQPSSAPPLGITWNLYDTHGNQLYTTIGVYQPGATSASYQRTTYQLFTGNSVTLGGTLISCAVIPPAPSLPCATINADGVVTQLGYDSAGDLTSSATPDGNGSEIATATFAYDNDGERTSEVSPDGNLSGANAANYTTTTAYNADAEKTSVTQAGGTGATVASRGTSYGYDADGSQTTVQDARGYTTSTAYNADNEPDLVTDPAGNGTLTCYDGDGNTAQTVPPVGVAASSLTTASCPSAYPSGYGNRLASDATTYTFDANGNQTATTTPAPAGQTGSETTTVAYDGNGNKVTITAPPASGSTSQVTQDAYNSAGELAAQTTGSGTSAASTTSYCYDPDGDTTAVVMPDGNSSATAPCETVSPWVISASSNPVQAAYQTTSSYDSARELVSSTSPATTAAPGGATTISGYDPAGNLRTSTDPDGVTTTWTYTPVGLQASISYSSPSAHAVSYLYDADGQRTAMTDATGSSSYTYDPFGELASSANGAHQTVGYGYDADGDTTGVTYPLPASATWATTATVGYGYNHADTLTSVTDFAGHQISITPTADGLPAVMNLGTTGDTLSSTYDNTDGISAMSLATSSSTLQSFAYSDAPAGDILSEADTPASSKSPATYTYDAQNRVTSMTPGTGSALSYAFDASGNLATTPTGAAGTYDHDGELTSTTLSGTTTGYTYNADGERLAASQGSTTVSSGTWNGAHQMIAYSDAAALMSSATYDGDGLRATATVTPAGGSSTIQNFVWNESAAVPQLLMDSGNAYIYTGGGAPAEQVKIATGDVSYLVSDLLGSVRGIVNSTGGLSSTTAYDSWGNPQTTGGLTSHTPFGYAGGYTDPTGLTYLINRYYDPQTGQFISVDPAVTQTLQPYEYAADNPISNTDPTGLWLRTCEEDRVVKNCKTRWTNWEVENVILPGLHAAEQYGGGGCSAIAHWIPGAAGQVLATACTITFGVSLPLFTAYIKWVNAKGRQHGIYVRIWYFRFVWWWRGWHSKWVPDAAYIWHN
jgi:RHS repeat-associated protein